MVGTRRLGETQAMPLATRSALAAAVVVALLAGCGGGDDDAASNRSTDDTTSTSESESVTVSSSTSTTALDAIACDPDAADPAALEALLPQDGPSGFELQPDDEFDTGPSDFDKAVSDDGYPDAEATLREAGFLRGYQRLWEDADETQLIAFVYEFCTDGGAQLYVGRFEEINADEDGEGFDVPGLPDAIGTSAGGEGRVGAKVLTTVGPYLILAVANGAIDAPEAEHLAIDLGLDLVERVNSAGA